MDIALGILAILAGIGLMGFGLLVYYTLLPLFYGMLGAGVGFFLGYLLTGNEFTQPGIVEFIIAIVMVVLFAGSALILEHVRRSLVGIFLGALVGLSIAGFLGTSGLVTVILGVVFAVIGAMLIPFAFDPLIILASAITGSAMLMDGIRLVLPDLTIVDRTLIRDGDIGPLAIWLVLSVIGLGWQFSNLSKWVGLGTNADSAS